MGVSINVGDVFKCQVTEIKSFGAVLLITGGIKGFIHISEISAGYVSSIEEHLQIGDVKDFKVVTIDSQKGRIYLSLKQLMPADVPTLPKKMGGKGLSKKETAFEEKLENWQKASDERLAIIGKRSKRR